MLVSAGPALAQTFEPGLIVRANGDTLRGEVENAFWVAAPAFIRFRATAASPTELLQPRQLRAVSFVGGRYFRYEALPLDHAAETRLNSPGYGNYFDRQVDSVLAEVLLPGPIELRRVLMPGAAYYALQRHGQPWLGLSERQYPAPVGHRGLAANRRQQLPRPAGAVLWRLPGSCGGCPGLRR